MSQKATVFPCLRYNDAQAAVDFLCRAFGFERHAVYTSEENPAVVQHAELIANGSMIMLGSAPASDDQRYKWQTPEQANGYVTMCTCVYIEDVDAHCKRAKAEGAQIIHGPYDNPGYPGRGYDARDPEGNLWSFTSYDPWQPG